MTAGAFDIVTVVVTWNGERWIGDCLRSLDRQAARSRIIVVDNGSTDSTLSQVEDVLGRTNPIDLEIISLSSNLGFTIAANRGLACALRNDAADGIFLLNQDTVLEHDCLSRLARVMQSHPDAGAIGALTLYPDGRIQHAGGYLDRPRMVGLHFGHHEKEAEYDCGQTREVEWVTGAAMLLRSRTLAQIGPFNEVFSPGYYEDVELCDRIRSAGMKVFFTPEARLIHHESSSFDLRDERIRLANRNRFLYLLPFFEDDRFTEAFLAAESRFLTENRMSDEARAICGAALDLLVRLPEAIRHRITTPADPDNIAGVARKIFPRLREVCLQSVARENDTG